MIKKKTLYVLSAVIIIVVILNITLILRPDDRCDTADVINAKVSVKPPEEHRNYIGFDLNKQNLTFGVLSPGATSKRAISAEYTKNASVNVWVEGDIFPWLIISPKHFDLQPGLKQEINFTLFVPNTAKGGTLEGKVILCYQDKK